jgi:hypothetical protein
MAMVIRQLQTFYTLSGASKGVCCLTDGFAIELLAKLDTTAERNCIICLDVFR